jgi:hypothetical protein
MQLRNIEADTTCINLLLFHFFYILLLLLLLLISSSSCVCQLVVGCYL